MPIIKFIKNEKQNASAMKGSIDYCLQKCKTVDSQTGQRYVSGINCNGVNAYKEFMTTKLANDANNGRYFYQYVQSFSPKDNVDYDKAHKIALEFAQKAWQGHEVLVTTHCDRNHIHTHFIINSVNFETGKKLRQNPNTLKSLRKLNDEICNKYNVAPLKPYTKTKEKRLSDGEYRMAMKGESWKFALMYTIDNAMKKCKTKKEFIDEMKKNGYFLCSHKMNDNLCCGCGTIHADEFERFVLQKIKEKLADFKEFELAGVTANNPKIEELKARQIAIDNEINETVKNVAGASETVMAYINENVERLHSEKLQIQAEIQHLSENRYSANEKIICDFDRFDELPFERKRELANAVIKKIYATSDKIDIIWNI